MSRWALNRHVFFLGGAQQLANSHHVMLTAPLAPDGHFGMGHDGETIIIGLHPGFNQPARGGTFCIEHRHGSPRLHGERSILRTEMTNGRSICGRYVAKTQILLRILSGPSAEQMVRIPHLESTSPSCACSAHSAR